MRDYKNIDVNVDLFADTDHSKYFIIDHKEVILGGMNIADEYHTKWHDYMAMIQSKRWTAAFEGRMLKSSPWPDPAPFVITLNDRNTTEIRMALIELINNARESVIIEHAYFSDDKVIEAVKLVAQGSGNSIIESFLRASWELTAKKGHMRWRSRTKSIQYDFNVSDFRATSDQGQAISLSLKSRHNDVALQLHGKLGRLSELINQNNPFPLDLTIKAADLA